MLYQVENKCFISLQVIVFQSFGLKKKKKKNWGNYMFHWVSWTAGGRAWNRSSCILTRFLVWDGVRAECTLAGRDDAKDLFIAGLHRILVKTLKMSENEYKTGKGSNHKAKSVIADACNWVERGHKNAELLFRKEQIYHQCCFSSETETINDI